MIISIWWLVPAFFAGAVSGVFLIALATADKDRDDRG